MRSGVSVRAAPHEQCSAGEGCDSLHLHEPGSAKVQAAHTPSALPRIRCHSASSTCRVSGPALGGEASGRNKLTRDAVVIVEQRACLRSLVEG